MDRVTDAVPMSVRTDSVIVVGSGMAGLVCALALAPRPVTLMTKTPRLEGGSSLWAKGGIAAAVGPEDTPEHHAADTLSAGAGLSDPESALRLAEEGVENLQWLVDEGVPFDRAVDGTLDLAREAAHGYARIVHAGGDATGRILMQALIKRVRATRSITVLEDTFAHDLLVGDGQVQGLVVHHPKKGWAYHYSSHVVLATGGIGMTWWHTSNPIESTGDGLAMAARAGANLADLEFVQFHPTALAVKNETNGASLPLLTEALRGAGALLLDESGNRFMVSEHPAAEMAPRDVVARAIEKRIRAGHRVYLDLRPVLTGGHSASFPQAIEASKRAGFNPETEPLPVIPAAHYHMGGIQTDHRGRTSIDGLWACGEVAATGVHGANRLASNSLLEAMVYARRVAADIRSHPGSRKKAPLLAPAAPNVPANSACAELKRIFDATRELMSRHVGVLRSGDGLETAFSQLSEFDRQMLVLSDRYVPHDPSSADTVVRWSETRNLLLIARLVTLAALQREESRGAHYRDDHPISTLEWQRHQTLTVDELDAA
jgi:L-aspartate oxidase